MKIKKILVPMTVMAFALFATLPASTENCPAPAQIERKCEHNLRMNKEMVKETLEDVIIHNEMSSPNVNKIKAYLLKNLKEKKYDEIISDMVAANNMRDIHVGFAWKNINEIFNTALYSDFIYDTDDVNVYKAVDKIIWDTADTILYKLLGSCVYKTPTFYNYTDGKYRYLAEPKYLKLKNGYYKNSKLITCTYEVDLRYKFKDTINLRKKASS